jgi:hypothetical protein
MTKKWLPLTYSPKIEPVLNKEITQTIRIKSKYHIGDQIAFYGWEGRPYRSLWSFRTPYWRLYYVKNITILNAGIIAGFDREEFDPEFKEERYGDSNYRATLWLWDELNWLAQKDGIVPNLYKPEYLGYELREILCDMNGSMAWSESGVEAQVIRWKP